MSDVAIKTIEEFDSPNGGGFCRARASLPPHFEHFPEHDHTADGQEEVYTALSGSATLHADGQDYHLAPGIFARVGPGVTRKITTGDEPIQLLAIGGTPGAAYTPPPFTEEGAPLPG
jgi:mannose-6-phosphate isomerase-like protein (cupin superfamily)